MGTFLGYIEPVPGRLYPLVPTLQELNRRGHRVSVRSGPAQVELLKTIGIDAHELAPSLADFQPQDWRARTRFGALIRARPVRREGARPGAGPGQGDRGRGTRCGDPGRDLLGCGSRRRAVRTSMGLLPALTGADPRPATRRRSGSGLKPRQGRISISRALVRTARSCRMSCVCAVHVSAGRPPGMPSGDGSRPDAATSTRQLRLVRIRSNAVTEPP